MSRCRGPIRVGIRSFGEFLCSLLKGHFTFRLGCEHLRQCSPVQAGGKGSGRQAGSSSAHYTHLLLFQASAALSSAG